MWMILAISGTGDFILVLAERLGNASGVKVIDGNDAIYLRIGVTKVPNELLKMGIFRCGRYVFGFGIGFG